MQEHRVRVQRGVLVQREYFFVQEGPRDHPRAVAVQDRPGLRVDVPHGEVDLILVEEGEVGALGEHLPDLHVVLLYLALLAGFAGVAVEEPRHPLAGRRVELDRERVGELAAVVGQYDRERLPVELRAQRPPDQGEGGADLGDGPVAEQEGQHEVRLPEQQRQQARRRPPARDHGVHLDHLEPPVLGHEGDEVVVGPAGEEGGVGRLRPGLLVGFWVLDPLGQVDVGDPGDLAQVYQLQQRRVGPPDLVPVRGVDLLEALMPFLYEGREQQREPGELCALGARALLGVHALPRLLPLRLDRLPHLVGKVAVMAQPAVAHALAAVADVGELLQPGAARDGGEGGAALVAVARLAVGAELPLGPAWPVVRARSAHAGVPAALLEAALVGGARRLEDAEFLDVLDEAAYVHADVSGELAGGLARGESHGDGFDGFPSESGIVLHDLASPFDGL